MARVLIIQKISLYKGKEHFWKARLGTAKLGVMFALFSGGPKKDQQFEINIAPIGDEQDLGPEASPKLRRARTIRIQYH